MKRIIAICFILALLSAFTAAAAAEEPAAAPEEDLPSREVIELEREGDFIREQEVGRNFRAAGGFAGGVLRIDMLGLNKILEAEDFAGLSSNVFLLGGGGTAGARIGHRVGGLGLGGSVDSRNNGQEAVLDIGFGGFLYERGLYMQDDIDIALGCMLGAGSKKLTLTADDPQDFSQIVGDVAGEGHNSVTMERGFTALKPQASLHYRLTSFTGLDFTAGYLLTHNFGSDWEIAGRSVSDGPLASFRGLNFRLRLTLGF